MASPLVGIIGAGSPSTRGYELARDVGYKLAQSELALICGGLGGVMEAASRGCREAGGTVIGLLPGADAASGNGYLTYALPTNLGHARNVLIAHAASVLIAVEGEYGTLSEIAIALKLARKVYALECPWTVRGLEPVKSPDEAVEKTLAALQGAS